MKPSGRFYSMIWKIFNNEFNQEESELSCKLPINLSSIISNKLQFSILISCYYLNVITLVAKILQM